MSRRHHDRPEAPASDPKPDPREHKTPDQYVAGWSACRDRFVDELRRSAAVNFNGEVCRELRRMADYFEGQRS